MENWIKEIKVDDLELDEKNKELIEVLGIEKYLEFVKIYGGTRFYVNMYDEIIKNARDKRIRKEYNRYNTRYLANKYNLTEERIRQITRDLGIDGQISIFE